MTEALPLDELLPRLRARAADPDRRTSSRPSHPMASSPEQLAQFGLTDAWEAWMAARMGAPWPPPHDED